MTPFTPGADYAIRSERLELARLRPEAVTSRYVDWLNDPDVVRYLELRGTAQDDRSVRAFVETCFQSDKDLLLAIKADGAHIGNIKLSIILAGHGLCSLSYFIGEPAFWRRGLAAEAIAAVTRYAIRNLSVLKIYATTYANNIGSIKALTKIGYQQEGRFRRHMLFEGALIDVSQYGFCADDLDTENGVYLSAEAAARAR